MAKQYEWKSGFAKTICDFLAMKRAMGYEYITQEETMKLFDRMAAERYPFQRNLTKQVCEDWMQHNAAFTPKTQNSRIGLLREYAKYLCSVGIAAYIIPTHYAVKEEKYDPHIFTNDELKAFFEAADNCEIIPWSPYRHYIIPVFFRLLYTTGVRSTEARCLTPSDVDLNTGRIFIKESKGWKQRIVYVSEDMLELMNRYNSHIEKLLPERNYFFPNQFNGMFSHTAPNIWFRKIWSSLPQAAKVVGNKPRVHDFRHTFCVTRINRWVEEGKDINVYLPYLSEYLGHVNYASTDYYLKLSEEFYPELKRRMAATNEHILPEVTDHENR